MTTPAKPPVVREWRRSKRTDNVQEVGTLPERYLTIQAMVDEHNALVAELRREKAAHMATCMGLHEADEELRSRPTRAELDAMRLDRDLCQTSWQEVSEEQVALKAKLAASEAALVDCKAHAVSYRQIISSYQDRLAAFSEVETPREEDARYIAELEANLAACEAERERLRDVLGGYACPGLGKCEATRLKDGSCIRQWTDCGDEAHKALAPATGPELCDRCHGEGRLLIMDFSQPEWTSCGACGGMGLAPATGPEEG